MNLVRVAFTGVGLGLLVIALPGSEDAPAWHLPQQVVLEMSKSPSSMQAPLLEPLQHSPISPSIRPFHEEEEQLATAALPQIEHEEELAVEAEQPWVDENPPVEEEPVWLVALNRPISLEPTARYAESPRPGSQRAFCRQRTTRSKTAASENDVVSFQADAHRQPPRPAELEQAEVKLTRVLRSETKSDVDVTLRSAEAPHAATARFPRRTMTSSVVEQP